ncbi:TcfC E-set like domain-containing protein [Alcaligenaceae bacterium A4P071]|nr:TcfC E-set like domain-containing protein [Alcaligenaceae bacterium A4P071]
MRVRGAPRSMFSTARIVSFFGLAGIGAVLGVGAPSQAALIVPPGFEDLLAGQSEQVEINIFGRSLGLFSIVVTPDTVRMEDPESVVQTLIADVDVEAEMRAKVLAALSREMPRNGHLICVGARGNSACGHIETDTAAVILDDRRSVLDVFLARDWMPTLRPQLTGFHTLTSTAENAFVHRQTVNLASGLRYRSFSVAGAGAQGVSARSYLGANWSFSQTGIGDSRRSHVEVNDLYYRHDLGARHYGQIGRMDQRNLASAQGGNFGFSMLPIERIEGARVGTTLAYANTAVAADGTPLTILLSRDSRIDAYRGAQLLGSQYLAAGVHQLSTDIFPEGSYAVTLRIFENGILNRTETLPFSKTGGSLGSRRTQWFVQVGRDVVDDRFNRERERSGTGVQAGVRMALNDQLFATAGVATRRGHVYAEGRLEGVYAFANGAATGSLAYFSGSDGARGNAQWLTVSQGVALNLYRYHMRGASCDRASSYDIRDIGCYRSLSVTLSAPAGKWSLIAGYSYNKSRGRWAGDPLWQDDLDRSPYRIERVYRRVEDQVTRAIQVGVSRSFPWRQSTISTRMGIYRQAAQQSRPADNGIYVGVSISLVRAPSGVDEPASYRTAGAELRRAPDGGAEMTYAANQTWAWSGDGYREVGVDLNGLGNERYLAGMRGRAEGRYGDVSGAASRSLRGGEAAGATSLTGTYASSLAIGGGNVYWGGNAGSGEPGAAIAVHVQTSDDTLEQYAAEISGPNARPIKLRFGDRAMLPLEGYQLTRTDIRDASIGGEEGVVSVARGSGAEEYFTTPGKIVRKEIASRITYTYVGRAIHHEGYRLGGASILNVPSAALDEDGGFVLNAASRLSSLYVWHQGAFFSCPLIVQGRRDVVQFVGDARCDGIAEAALPLSIVSQKHVGRFLRHVGQQGSTYGRPGS